MMACCRVPRKERPQSRDGRLYSIVSVQIVVVTPVSGGQCCLHLLGCDTM